MPAFPSPPPAPADPFKEESSVVTDLVEAASDQQPTPSPVPTSSRAPVTSKNISWSPGSVTRLQRIHRNRHKGAVVWLTGLSGSGKSSLSRALEWELFRMGMQVYVLDGDNLRHGLNSDLGFSKSDREENIRRVAEVAKCMADAGHVVITAFISPYRIDRIRAREIALDSGGDFFEVYLDAPLSVCETRDAKGLYKKARAGEIQDFTGISAPYEPPLTPELSIHTHTQSLQESVECAVAFLRPRLIMVDDQTTSGD